MLSFNKPFTVVPEVLADLIRLHFVGLGEHFRSQDRNALIGERGEGRDDGRRGEKFSLRHGANSYG